MALNWGGAATGALGGAASGATVGSFVPGIGTGIGAGVGGLFGGIAGLFGSKNNKRPESGGYEQVPTKTPEQQRGLSQILGNLNQMGGPNGSYGRAQNYLSSILQGGQEGYDEFSQPYLQQFEQQIIPGLTERFAGLGGGMGGGIGSSSGLGQAIGGAGANLQAQLAQLYSQRQMQASGAITDQYNNLANLGLNQNQFENVYRDEGESPLGGIASTLSEQGISKLLPLLADWLKNRNGSGVTSLQDSISNSNPSSPYGGGASYNPYTGMQ